MVEPARAPRARLSVHSFEPIFDEPLVRTLRENAACNVEAVPLGVGEEPARTPFSVHALGIDSRIATRENRDATKIVGMTTFDEFVAFRGSTGSIRSRWTSREPRNSRCEVLSTHCSATGRTYAW